MDVIRRVESSEINIDVFNCILGGKQRRIRLKTYSLFRMKET